MLEPVKRHQEPCKRKEYNQGSTRCACPVWIRGTLHGKRVTVASVQVPAGTKMLGHGKREGSSSAVLEDRGPVRPEAYAVIVPPMSEPRESGEAAAPGFARILIGA